MPPAELWALEQQLKKAGVPVRTRVPLPRVNLALADWRRRNCPPPGQFPEQFQRYTAWLKEQRSLLCPTRYPGESATDYLRRLRMALDSPETVSEFERPTIEAALAVLVDQMNPLLPGINAKEEEDFNGGDWEHWRLNLSLFARERLSPKSRTRQPNDPEPSSPQILALIPEEVTICAAALNEIWMYEEIPPWTPKRMARIWKLVRIGQMTSHAVIWYGRRRSMNEFDGLEGWMNAAPWMW